MGQGHAATWLPRPLKEWRRPAARDLTEIRRAICDLRPCCRASVALRPEATVTACGWKPQLRHKPRPARHQLPGGFIRAAASRRSWRASIQLYQ